jgi:hypothetical protein
MLVEENRVDFDVLGEFVRLLTENGMRWDFTREERICDLRRLG